MINLIITDDHSIVRDGIKAMLSGSEEDITIVGEAASGKDLIEKLAGQKADVVLMDIQMPEMDGLEATRYIKEHFPHIKVIMLSMMENEKYVTESMNAGASGYTLKTIEGEELIYAIKTVARGEVYISTQIAMKLLKYRHEPKSSSDTSSTPSPAFITQATSSTISARELEVLRLIAQGYTNAEIADLLFTSKRTIECHRQSLLEKTGSKNTAALMMYAYKQGLLEESGESSATK